MPRRRITGNKKGPEKNSQKKSGQTKVDKTDPKRFIFQDEKGYPLVDLRRVLELSDVELEDYHNRVMKEYFARYGDKRIRCISCDTKISDPKEMMLLIGGAPLHDSCAIHFFRKLGKDLGNPEHWISPYENEYIKRILRLKFDNKK